MLYKKRMCRAFQQYLYHFYPVNENSPSRRRGKFCTFSDVDRLASNGILDMLLISWKNGRNVRTYGVNGSRNCIMKIPFICIVIIASCSFHVSAHTKLFSDFKYDFNKAIGRRSVSYDGIYRHLFPPGLELSHHQTTANNRINMELSRRLRQIEKFIERRKAITSKENEKYRLLPQRRTYQNYEYLNEEKPRNLVNYRFDSSILADARPYLSKDDFSFERNEDDNEEEQSITENYHKLHQMENESKDEKAAEDFVDNSTFKNVKFVNNTNEFAYLPSDARFLEKFDENGTPINIQDSKPTTKFHIDHRSDGKFSDRTDPSRPLKDSKNRDRHDEVIAVRPSVQESDTAGVYIIAVVAGISAAATVGLIAVAIGWYNLQKHVKNASDVEYPAYGVTGPNKEISPSGDRRLAQSAQMYHYQHQKQQIIAMESRAATGDGHGSVSDDSDEENEEGDYTVYECPGLAPTGEMEVKNPLFQDDPTPAQTPPVKPAGDEKK